MRSIALLGLAAAGAVSGPAVADGPACTADSKLAESKVAAGSEEPTMPFVTVGGEQVERPITETHLVDGRTVHMRLLHEELQLTYVHGLISPEEIATLVRLADERGGFIRSPVKTQGQGADVAADGRRNSTSCPMLWPLVYGAGATREQLRQQRPAFLEELELVERIAARVASLFSAAGLELTAQQIEPLQLVRCALRPHASCPLPIAAHPMADAARGVADRDQAMFGPHHDYHAPASDGRLGSSVQGEQRAFTLLLFGTTSAPGAGGETHFPLLGAKVAPRAGDAIAWANVGDDGAPNPRSLHEGLPPAPGEEKVAINCWIADRPFSTEELAKAYRT